MTQAELTRAKRLARPSVAGRSPPACWITERLRARLTPGRKSGKVTSPTLGPGGTLLGKLQVIGDELVLDVNARGRLERAREWLEQIPGVRFKSVQSKDTLNDPSPLDDRLPGPEPDIPPTEMAAVLRQVLHQHAMRWLDESIPALGGKTPRQTVKTKAGRKQVALMIRTWPNQEGPDGKKISPPREEMLRELGLS